MQRKNKGFSLIELLIVVAIILIIAAIAIPNLVRSRIAANEASAVGSLRSINTACMTYSANYGGFPPTLASLRPAGGVPTPAAADLIDSVLAGGTKSGYVFTYSPGPLLPASSRTTRSTATRLPRAPLDSGISSSTYPA